MTLFYDQKTSNAQLAKRLINHVFGRFFGVEVHLTKYHPPNRKAAERLRPLFSNAAWKKRVHLEHGVFDPEREELFIFHDCGLFGCLSVTLWCICDLFALGYVPKNINFSCTLSAYKDEPSNDLYSELFETQFTEEIVDKITQYPKSRFRRFNHHGYYKNIDCELFSLLVKAYLQPNSMVTARVEALQSRYVAPEKRYLGGWYRGTDKAIEVQPTDSSLYIEAAEKLIENGSADRILIQTDQAQVCNIFKGYFGGICDVIEELPRTEGRVAFHKNGSISGHRLEHAIDMIATVSIISNMSHVISYTGNIGAWIVLMRGASKNVWQATPDGIALQ